MSDEYQEARVVDALGNVFVGQVAAFGPAKANLACKLCVKAKPRFAHKKLSDENTRGSLVVVDRGKVSFQTKALRVQEAGGVGCIFINTSDEPFVAFGDNDQAQTVHIPCCCIGLSDGTYLTKTASLVTLTFEPPGGWGAGGARGSLSRERAGSVGRSSVGAPPVGAASFVLDPASPVVPAATLARAQYTYKSDNPTDLTFVKGELIEVVSEDSPGQGWWSGTIMQRQGIFPANYVEKLSAEEAAHALGPSISASAGLEGMRRSVVSAGGEGPSKSVAFLEKQREEERKLEQTVQKWYDGLYSQALERGDPKSIQRALDTSEDFAGPAAEWRVKLEKMKAIATQRAMQQLHAVADQHMQSKFTRDYAKLKGQLEWWDAMHA